MNSRGGTRAVESAITGSPHAFLAQQVPTNGRRRLAARTDRRRGILQIAYYLTFMGSKKIRACP